MPIKQSVMERKWYYRAAKVLFIVLPFIALAVMFFKSDVAMPKFTEKDLTAFAQANAGVIVYAVLGVILYFILLNLVWKAILYIIFGGIEKDVVDKSGAASQPSQSAAAPGLSALSDEDKKQIGFYFSILIILGIIYYVYFIWQPAGLPGGKYVNGRGSACVPTGCGSEWYCAGSYYEDGLEKRINGCLTRRAGEIYSSWSGTCRKCP